MEKILELFYEILYVAYINLSKPKCWPFFVLLSIETTENRKKVTFAKILIYI